MLLRESFFYHNKIFCISVGELLDSSSLKGLTGTISVDETRKYKLDARIQVDQTKDRMTYTPIIIIEVPDWKNIQLNGVLNYQKMKAFDADLTMEGVTDEPVIFQSMLLFVIFYSCMIYILKMTEISNLIVRQKYQFFFTKRVVKLSIAKTNMTLPLPYCISSSIFSSLLASCKSLYFHVFFIS